MLYNLEKKDFILQPKVAHCEMFATAHSAAKFFFFHRVLRHSMATTVCALLAQSNSHDIGNEKSSIIQFFGKLEIEFSLEIEFQFSILLVGPDHHSIHFSWMKR